MGRGSANWNQTGETKMNYMYVSDLHGNILLYNQLEKLITHENPNILIIGGDLFAYSAQADDQIKFIDDYFTKYIKRISIPIFMFLAIAIDHYQ